MRIQFLKSKPFLEFTGTVVFVSTIFVEDRSNFFFFFTKGVNNMVKASAVVVFYTLVI